MRDVLEEELASRLRALGDTVADGFPPPVDLELQVARQRRRTRAARRWASVGIAASIVATVAMVAVVHGTSGHGSIHVTSTGTTAPPIADHLPVGTTILSAEGRYVQSLNAAGHGTATMVKVPEGSVVTYARATGDHREIWYLSSRKGVHACGDVVRADLDSGGSTIITHAVAFDVAPDGSRVALYGAGDLAADRCAPVKTAASGRVVVVDLAHHTSSAMALANVTNMRWSPDSSYLAVVGCAARACTSFSRIDVPADLGGPLTASPVSWSAYPDQSIRSATIEFGPDGLYMLKQLRPIAGQTTATVRIDRLDPQGVQPVQSLFSSEQWKVAQLVPTATGTDVVAAPLRSKPAKWGLYRVEAGNLALLRTLVDPGTFTPVVALTAG